MVENAKRQKTPNEVALTILLVALTIVFGWGCDFIAILQIWSSNLRSG